MKIILGLILFSFVSCNLESKRPNVERIKSATKNEGLPDFVHKYIKENLQGWRLLSLKEQDSIHKNSSDSAQKCYVLADINCDNKVDFTGIIKDSAGNFKIYQIRSLDKYYSGGELEPF